MAIHSPNTQTLESSIDCHEKSSDFSRNDDENAVNKKVDSRNEAQINEPQAAESAQSAQNKRSAVSLENKGYRSALADVSLENKRSAVSLEKPTPFILRDDSGENISHLNANFCELTAMYWAWKNVDSSYYGLFHYRRVLDFSGKVKRSKQFDVNRVSVKPRDIVRKFRLDKRTILAELEKSPIILAQPMVVPLGFETSQGVSQYDIYARDHRKRDLDIVIDIIRAKFPHLVESMEAVLFTPGVQLSWCNMFIMRKDLYHEYCEFLFGVLLEAHGKIDLSGYNPYQSRIYGFIAERLLNVFVYHKIFYARIQPIYKHHFVLREPKPLFGSVATGDTRRFYLCGIRIRKSKIQT